MPEATFELKTVGGKPLVVCTYDGQTGTARVFSKGEEDARSRAEEQARDKAAKAAQGGV
jgi:hypothetical protein